MSDNERSSPSLPKCSVCLVHGEAPIELERLSSVQMLRARRDVETIPTEDSNEVTHFVARIHAIYEVTPADAITCNFPDRTKHARGFVIDSRCGKRMKIGHICAKTYLGGDGEAVLAKIEREFGKGQGERSALEKDPSAMLATLAEIEPMVASAQGFRDKLPQAVPALAAEIERRLKLSGGRKTEVIIAKEFGSESIIAQLVGLEVGDSKLATTALRALRERVQALKTESDSSDLDVMVTLSRLSKRRSALHSDVDRLEKLARESARFFTVENMQLLLAAATVKDVSVDADASYRFKSNTGWRRLGRDGRLHQL